MQPCFEGVTMAAQAQLKARFSVIEGHYKFIFDKGLCVFLSHPCGTKSGKYTVVFASRSQRYSS